MAVTLIDARVAAEVVEILLSLHVPQKNAFTTRQNSRYGCIVVASDVVFTLDDLTRFWRQRVQVNSFSESLNTCCNASLTDSRSRQFKLQQFQGERKTDEKNFFSKHDLFLESRRAFHTIVLGFTFHLISSRLGNFDSTDYSRQFSQLYKENRFVENRVSPTHLPKFFFFVFFRSSHYTNVSRREQSELLSSIVDASEKEILIACLTYSPSYSLMTTACIDRK